MINLKYQASRLFNILTMIILSGLCVLLNDLTKIDFHRLDLPKDKPEFSAHGMQGNLYAPSGVLLYQLNAESGNQFPGTSKIQLNKLLLKAYSESSGLIQETLSSANGWLDTKTSQGFLGESVVIIIANPDPAQVIHVYTESVNLDGVKRFATSNSPIRGTQGKSVLIGVGFSVDYEQKLLKINSKVKVIYVK